MYIAYMYMCTGYDVVVIHDCTTYNNMNTHNGIYMYEHLHVHVP